MPGIDRPARRHPVVTIIGVLSGVLGTTVLLSLLFSWLVETRQTRSVFVTAQTTRVALTVLDEQAPFMLGSVLLCLPREKPRRPKDHAPFMSCDQGGWFAVRSSEELPPAAEVSGASWIDGSPWPEAVIFDPPPGTKIEFEIVGDYVEIRFLKLPADLRQMPGVVEGARLIMTIADFEERGRHLVRAELELGTPPGISQRGYVTSGNISFRAHATLTYSLENRPSILLRDDRIPAGGFVEFIDMRSRKPSPMNVQIMADAAEGSFDIQAVNVPAPTAAVLQYVGTEPLRLVPLWTDLITKDPFISLLSVLASLTGFVTVAQIKRRRSK